MDVHLLHCPRCGKGFYVDSQSPALPVSEFVCTICQFQFRMQFDNHRRLLIPVVDQDTDFVPEPEFQPHFHKNKSESSDPVTFRLKQKWQDVLENFTHSEVHTEFIQLCQKLDRTQFAEERYQYLKKALGDDPEVDKRIRQITMRNSQSEVISDRLLLESNKIPRWRNLIILCVITVVIILSGTLLPSLYWLSFIGILFLIGLLFTLHRYH